MSSVFSKYKKQRRYFRLKKKKKELSGKKRDSSLSDAVFIASVEIRTLHYLFSWQC